MKIKELKRHLRENIDLKELVEIIKESEFGLSILNIFIEKTDILDSEKEFYTDNYNKVMEHGYLFREACIDFLESLRQEDMVTIRLQNFASLF